MEKTHGGPCSTLAGNNLRTRSQCPSLSGSGASVQSFRRPRSRARQQADGALANGRSGQPSVRASLATAQSATPVSRNATIPEEQSTSRPECEAVDLETILKERDACGVGFIANLKSQRSHVIVEQALTSLGCMEHRGACSADNDSGDGAGLMTQIPWDLFKEEFPELNEKTTGVGMLFLPNDDKLAALAKQIIEDVVKAEGRCHIVGWRDVPVVKEVVGPLAKATEPRIVQVFIESNSGLAGSDLEREFFILRKLIEKEKVQRFAAEGADSSDFYICTLSTKLIVYKGMLRSVVVGQYYKDLRNEKYTTAFAVYHRRFSTNTNPRWPLAQPMRTLGHNGEINTLQGNLNWVASREHSLSNPIWEGRESELLPLCNAAESDSANLDHVAELLMRTGVASEEALMILVPEAYDNHPDLQKAYPEVVGFYEFYEGLQEGWDGPALLVFSDGEHVGARLDRNGLRPARFWVTSDDMVYVASEVGVLNDVLTNVDNVVRKGRLGPGQTIVADLTHGTFKEHAQIAKEVGSRAPYAEWLSSSSRLAELGGSSYTAEPQMSSAQVLKLQAANGFGQEDSTMIIEGMASNGAEPTYCMGDDIPLPVLSSRPHQLGDYFKQRFAQVTNPPIDPLREGLVMSLNMRLGKRGNLLQPGPGAYRQLLLESPVLLENELEAIKTSSGLTTTGFTLHYESGKPGAMEEALRQLCADVEAAVEKGTEIVVLSDRGSMDAERPPIPTLLAVGAVHHHLIKKGLRTETSIVVETAQCFSTHHVALLVGYGAHAICPYLAFETCRQWRASSRTASLIKSGKLPDVSIEKCQKNYKKALEKGVLKILSKMGISLLSCYHGAQIFEIYGLGKEVVDFAFKGSVSRIGGMSLADLQREAESFWVKGFPEKAMNKLEDFGFIQSRPKGEYHANNQQMSKLLHKAIGLGNKGAAPQEAYEAYMQHFKDSPASFLRDCMELTPAGPPVALEEVEPAAAIMERFCTGGMSLGAISRETHETIAIAMNRIGGKSNSGEGGEDPQRWEPVSDVDANGNSPTFPHLKGLQSGDLASSRIKQVASGRFGVTPQFMVNADQLEIKIAQGAKPGEGGQLPAKKVSPYIANLRRSKPGVPLISPPPHHDIYSIEDLAQLIYDLHQVSPTAKVSVKLVAQAGIGTVASGVAKANADIIQISGHDGGTGASPISSIKHAGGPIEMGLVETHRSLTENQLRERVLLRVDGGMRNGRDVMLVAALGGDEYGFGTVAMIATGCIMARVCHTNNCPVGVASQREELRARFPGAPADLVNYFHFVAEEVRAGLASLGMRSMDELIGRGDLLKQRPITLAKTEGLDLSFLTHYAGETAPSSSRAAQEVHSNGPVLDDEILADPEVQAAIKEEGSVHRKFSIVNTDRAAFGRVGGAVAKLHGDSGFAGTLSFDLEGSAGQSFACFLVAGIKLRLVGEANDYVGKGMAGGEVVIVPPPGSKFKAEEASLVGNTCLYGATGGRLFVNGRAGERFAVRNSLAEAVVEGTGDHCCEYMTGGTVVCLGTTGRNVAAGMTGGLGYFYDEEGDFPDKVNTEIVAIQRVSTAAGEQQLKKLIQDHVDLTGSAKGAALLADWSNVLPRFWQLVPPSESFTPEASEEAVNRASAEDRVPATAA
ncbi:Ferredoxin-dependent glutamate synthase, chloroplastic [Coccomyxa sp. Obi]|nr:Ferredoxin-dependent glutamate synthase, chloroplastic [Coccomyxa sp. Obi]